MDSIDVIIVNYYSTACLLECLETVYQFNENIPLNVLIQDNGSDNSNLIEEYFPKARLDRNPRNIGFAAAVNNAIKKSNAPYVVILNPDSFVTKGFFRACCKYMEGNPLVGILGPKVLNNDGSVQGSARAFPTPITGFFGRTSLLSKLFPNNLFTRKSILTFKNGGITPTEVDWVSGACMFVRRDAIEAVGELDERFFMYWEDVDWCRRMWQKGWKVVYFPAVSVVHTVGASSDKQPIKSKFEFHKSCYNYFVKYPLWPVLVTRLVFLFGLSARLLILLLFDVRIFFSAKPKDRKSHILFFISEDWFFVSHFLSRAIAALKNGYNVTVVTNVNKHKEVIEEKGIRVIPLKLERKSKNLLHEIQHIINLYKIFQKQRPTIVHNIAIKPMIYGSIAAVFARIPFVINAVVGLGAIFIKEGRKASFVQIIVLFIYKCLFFITKSKVIFENQDDVLMFINDNIAKKEQVVLIKGAGVDINHYKYFPETQCMPVVVLVSRMLWDKGIGEFVDSARMLREEKVRCRFVLVGNPDPENPESISEETLEKWHNKKLIEWWGYREDIPNVLTKSNIVVLPSYREGLPKVLLEAASCGRAIVSTDVPGCREIVKHNQNGLIVPPHDSKALAEAIKILIQNEGLRKNMGLKGREIIEAEFTEEIVIRQTMNLYKELCCN